LVEENFSISASNATASMTVGGTRVPRDGELDKACERMKGVSIVGDNVMKTGQHAI